MGVSASSCYSNNEKAENNFSLTDNQKTLIIDYWNSSSRDTKLFTDSWCQAMQLCPEIRNIFRARFEQDSDRCLNGLTTEIEAFFEMLIVELKLDSAKCSMFCHQLGKRHAAYCADGFQPFYWDIFTACLLRAFEQHTTDRSQFGMGRFGLMMAWRHLVIIITERMRTAYMREILGSNRRSFKKPLPFL